MADATSEVTLEFHGALADRFAPLGVRRGSRVRVDVSTNGAANVEELLSHLVHADARYAHVFDVQRRALPEHVEVVLNDRVLDLQGGLAARLQPGDVLAFLPAHAGG